jgi:uncharacterized protein YccT (UPF0319 family)
MTDITFSGPAIVVITALLGVLVGTIGKLHLQLMTGQREHMEQLLAAKDEQIEAVCLERDILRKMADRAITRLEQAADANNQRLGHDSLPRLADVEAEHNSPVSQKQEDTAVLATLRARLVAAELALVMGDLIRWEPP